MLGLLTICDGEPKYNFGSALKPSKTTFYERIHCKSTYCGYSYHQPAANCLIKDHTRRVRSFCESVNENNNVSRKSLASRFTRYTICVHLVKPIAFSCDFELNGRISDAINIHNIDNFSKKTSIWDTEASKSSLFRKHLRSTNALCDCKCGWNFCFNHKNVCNVRYKVKLQSCDFGLAC